MFDLKNEFVKAGANSSNQNNGALSSRILRQSDESGINTYRDLVYSAQSGADENENQSINFNIADSELTRSLLQNNFSGNPSGPLNQLQNADTSSCMSPTSTFSKAYSSQFQDALRSSERMLEQAKLESLQMAEELRNADKSITDIHLPLKLPGKLIKINLRRRYVALYKSTQLGTLPSQFPMLEGAALPRES